MNFKEKGVNISLPSLRIDAFSLDVMSKVQDIKKSSLTFAPEAGSQRLRNVINKGLTEEVILDGARQAFEGGWNKVKLVFYAWTSDGDGRRYARRSRSSPIRSQIVIMMRFRRSSGTENVRSRSAPPSLCQSRSPRSSGRRCARQGELSRQGADRSTMTHERAAEPVRVSNITGMRRM